MVENGEGMEPSEQDEFKPANQEPDFEDSQDVSEDDIESFGNELEQEFQKQVQKDQEESDSADGQDTAPDQPPQIPQNEDIPQNPPQSYESTEENNLSQEADQPDSPRPSQQRSNTQQEMKQQSSQPKRSQQNIEQQRPQNQKRHESRQREQKQEHQNPNTRGIEADIPEPARTKEISVPEIDKGPLFIRREKFEKAAHLIQEMRYLSQQIESTVNTIEEDLQRDQGTEKQVRELLQGFEEDRKEVERIVSPKED